MFKFLLKVAFVILGLYVLYQIPFFSNYVDMIGASILEKAGNVVSEVDRLRGKVEVAKEKIDETKETIDNFTDTVKKTTDQVESGITTAKTAIDSVSSAFDIEAGADKPVDEQQPANTPSETK